MGHILMLVAVVTTGGEDGEEQLVVTTCGPWAWPAVGPVACPVPQGPLSRALGKHHPEKGPKAQGSGRSGGLLEEKEFNTGVLSDIGIMSSPLLFTGTLRQGTWGVSRHQCIPKWVDSISGGA